MSSIFYDNANLHGPTVMFDEDHNTMAHTIDRNDNDFITIYLPAPKIISSVIFMNRGLHLKRLDNTKVTLVNLEEQQHDCGYVRLQHETPNEVVTVECNNLSFRSKRIIISKSSTASSLNIAELRVCYLILRKYTNEIIFLIIVLYI